MAIHHPWRITLKESITLCLVTNLMKRKEFQVFLVVYYSINNFLENKRHIMDVFKMCFWYGINEDYFCTCDGMIYVKISGQVGAASLMAQSKMSGVFFETKGYPYEQREVHKIDKKPGTDVCHRSQTTVHYWRRWVQVLLQKVTAWHNSNWYGPVF